MWNVADSTEGAHADRMRLHLETAQRIADLGSWEADVERARLRCSENAYRILGLPVEAETTYSTALAVVHPDDRRRVVEAHRAAVDGGRYSVEHRVIRSDGSVRHLRQEAVVERDDAEAVRLIGVMQDITAGVELTRSIVDTESRRRELLHRLIQASEEERARLANDLHDGPLQLLTVAAMRLEHLHMVEPEVPEPVGACIDGLRDAMAQLRDVLFHLRPALGARTRDSVVQLARIILPGTSATVEVAGEDTTAGARHALLGVVQEILWSIRDRGEPSAVEIDVALRTDRVDVEVVETTAASTTGRRANVVPLGVRERIDALGGSWSCDERATRRAFWCTLPVAADQR